MSTRREFLASSAALGGAALLSPRGVAAAASSQLGASRTPVHTLNTPKLPWKMKNGVKEFHLIAEPVRTEFVPGFVVNAWGYNGSTMGPTIEAIEGDRVRILVTNKLPEVTSIHWHGILLPNGMDGVAGLNQPHIPPGETWAYEFTLRQSGTQMYHPHSDEMLQMAMGMMGFFIIHPRSAAERPVDRDFAIMLHEWFIEPGSFTPNASVMTDFNTFTFNSRIFPGIEPLVVRTGQRVRVRFGNLSMDSHPIHFHGHQWSMTGTDAGPVPRSAQWKETTINVPVGSTRDMEFVADEPGDWAFHCHKSHHTMGPMDHAVPNMIGVDQSGVQEKIQALLPGYHQMGNTGMHEHAMMQGHMAGPRNTPPMMAGEGPYGMVGMGGMFTLLKVRDGIRSYDDPGWYKQPKGTQAWKVSE